MAQIKQVVGTRTALTVTGLSTLANTTYVVSSAYNCTTNQPLDAIVEIAVATTNTPLAYNKQVLAFVIESLDNTNYRSGPTSGTTTTDEPNLKFLGAVPVNSTSTTEMATFSIVQALGYVPAYFKVVIKNETGLTLTSGTVYTSEIQSVVV